ncbi:MAG: N2,N2-dimethylguanosine tRNA methyltransferase, partial [Synechococcaceae cyanobacterium]|nr:N2,N2-dimethylguanosine tRNA methyltransferase [Synechococcaceae cyanobacterium]
RLRRRPGRGEEQALGLLAHCHACGSQELQPLIRLRQWQPCLCSAGPSLQPLAISGPLWLGALQDPLLLGAMVAQATAAPAVSLDPGTGRLLARLAADPGLPARCWPLAEIGRRLGGGPPPLASLVAALQSEGWLAQASGLMHGQLRSDAPWSVILQMGRRLIASTAAAAK